MELRKVICDKCGETGATYFPAGAEITCVRCGGSMVPDVKQAEHYAQSLDTSKPTNPKDAVGTRKPPSSCVPQTVMAEVGVGMLEGARKYGRHNFREVGVRASVYYDAMRRHMDYWWEGEDTDPDSGLSHVTKAICCLVVLRDAMIQNKLTDDRPPKADVASHRAEMQRMVNDLFERYPQAAAAFVEKHLDTPPCPVCDDVAGHKEACGVETFVQPLVRPRAPDFDIPTLDVQMPVVPNFDDTPPFELTEDRTCPVCGVPEGFPHKGWCETMQVQAKHSQCELCGGWGGAHSDSCENRLEKLRPGEPDPRD